MFPDGTALAVHRHARKVAHMLVGAGELVEQRGLSAVLIPHQGKGQGLSLRQRIFLLPVMEFSSLSIARMMFFCFL